MARMHARSPDGTLAAIEFEAPQEPEFQMGGGGLYGTASDYVAFERVFLNEGRANGRSVFKPETVRLMAANAIGDLNVQPLKTGSRTCRTTRSSFPAWSRSGGLDL